MYCFVQPRVSKPNFLILVFPIVAHSCKVPKTLAIPVGRTSIFGRIFLFCPIRRMNPTHVLAASVPSRDVPNLCFFWDIIVRKTQGRL